MMVVVRHPRTSEVETGGWRTEGHPQQLSILRASLGPMRMHRHWSSLVWSGGFFRGPTPCHEHCVPTGGCMALDGTGAGRPHSLHLLTIQQVGIFP